MSIMVVNRPPACTNQMSQASMAVRAVCCAVIYMHMLYWLDLNIDLVQVAGSKMLLCVDVAVEAQLPPVLSPNRL